MRVFVSSTYVDLADHRKAVTDVLTRMKVRHSAMEFFGSRADEPEPASYAEIDECDILIGIYGWRYGWRPTPGGSSITEQEFFYARERGKRCLCYVVDAQHAWPVALVDRAPDADALEHFKGGIGKLIRSLFTTPDNLAKQVAADLARELTAAPSPESFGGLVRLNWEVFSPEVQGVLSTAYAQAHATAEDGVVATEHVVTALANTPNTARALFSVFSRVRIVPLSPGLQQPALDELFAYDRPISSCVLVSMNRILPQHSPTQRLLAIELAVDLLKFGTGGSVANFRVAGVDAIAVERTASAHSGDCQ